VSFKDNVVIPYEGIRADALTPGQRYLLLTLIQTYTSHLRPGHDQVWMEEIKRHLSETWFAWMGGFGENDVFYYKVHSPVTDIEQPLPGRNLIYLAYFLPKELEDLSS
jgi:hypothetical protein